MQIAAAQLQGFGFDSGLHVYNCTTSMYCGLLHAEYMHAYMMSVSPSRDTPRHTHLPFLLDQWPEKLPPVHEECALLASLYINK